ncbi:DNA endonuclease [Rossellomorea aquimaris]|uniref:DNA endonuclease n=1 Tax=Rossellomorea aquimaris TaxID=189382 RepID=A0A5D4U9F1_9BACI|nr:DNA endonuclease [Rossellomorea aquimaris]TYS76855.1 DNA endonuclease [Rossellomorea aquimaris]TYS83760.1 DNA endonuclease [Rossellomorea aquimaris]
MENFLNLSFIQRNLLIGSIMGDGEITKIYPNSRRKNHSYREHYGIEQENYRTWKASFFPNLFYLTKKSQTMRSKSDPLFTELFPYFYNNHSKQIPIMLLKYCTSPYFLVALYLDDGSLSISKRINHQNKKIYLTPHVYLYLQNYPKEELEVLQQHIFDTFQINFKLSKRRDGYGYILKGTSTDLTYNFLNLLSPITLTCESMYYKSNWEWRLKQEEEKFFKQYPKYQIIASSSDRFKNYTAGEVRKMILLKKNGVKDIEIAKTLGRSYWSVVYKLRELRSEGIL